MQADVDLELRTLREEDERSFLEAAAEFNAEASGVEFALGWTEPMSFGEYVRLMDCWSRGERLPSGYVPAGFYVGVVGGTVVGRVSVRFELNAFLSRVGGHVGYAVRPSQRRRGYATAMLRLALPICAAHGIKRALVTCDVDNESSRRVLERCGGVFERLTSEPALKVQKRRYWLETS